MSQPKMIDILATYLLAIARADDIETARREANLALAVIARAGGSK